MGISKRGIPSECHRIPSDTDCGVSDMDPQQLLNENEAFDANKVQLLDHVVQLMYSGNEQQVRVTCICVFYAGGSAV